MLLNGVPVIFRWTLAETILINQVPPKKELWASCFGFAVFSVMVTVMWGNMTKDSSQCCQREDWDSDNGSWTVSWKVRTLTVYCTFIIILIFFIIFSFKLLFYSFQNLPINVSICWDPTLVLLLNSLYTALLYYCYSLILWFNYINVKIYNLKISKCTAQDWRL